MWIKKLLVLVQKLMCIRLRDDMGFTSVQLLVFLTITLFLFVTKVWLLICGQFGTALKPLISILSCSVKCNRNILKYSIFNISKNP